MTLSDLATALVRFGRERRARAADERLLREAAVAGCILQLWERITVIEDVLSRQEERPWE